MAPWDALKELLYIPTYKPWWWNYTKHPHQRGQLGKTADFVGRGLRKGAKKFSKNKYVRKLLPYTPALGFLGAAATEPRLAREFLLLSGITAGTAVTAMHPRKVYNAFYKSFDAIQEGFARAGKNKYGRELVPLSPSFAFLAASFAAPPLAPFFLTLAGVSAYTAAGAMHPRGTWGRTKQAISTPFIYTGKGVKKLATGIYHRTSHYRRKQLEPEIGRVQNLEREFSIAENKLYAAPVSSPEEWQRLDKIAEKIRDAKDDLRHYTNETFSGITRRGKEYAAKLYKDAIEPFMGFVMRRISELRALVQGTEYANEVYALTSSATTQYNRLRATLNLGTY